MKKIAYFIDSDDPGGAETLIIELIRYSKDSDYTFEVLHFGNSWIEESCRKYGIPSVLVTGHKYYKSIVTIPVFMFIFFLFLKKRNISILHSHLFDSIVAASIPAFLAGIPHVGTLHDVFSIENNKLRCYILKLTALIGTRIVTVSKQISIHLNYLCKWGRNYSVIKNGVDISKFRNLENTITKKSLGIDDDIFVIISVGRLVEVKGFDVLIQAIDLLKNINDKIVLVIIGDGPERQNYEEMIASFNLEKHIKMLGHRDDVHSLLSVGDCYALASRSEGLSCSIIEAMAAGLPLIVTDVGGNGELVKQGVNGLLVDSENPKNLADAIKILLYDGAKRNELAKNSLIISEEEFSIDSTLKQYIKCYNRLSS